VSLEARIAFSKDFLAAYSDLPLKVQKKVREFTEKFQQDPTQPGLNFERIAGARDDKVRSLRIDQAYRVIVVHPPKGDVFLCVWVAHHDDAYAWVKNKRFEVNPHSGVFQVFHVEERTEVVRARKAARPEPVALLFAERDDEDLLLAGVPLPLLPAVRALRTEADLDGLAPHLPEDAAELLYALAAGFSVTEALAEVDPSKAPKERVDTQDFATALAEPASQRQFKVVEDDQELATILEAPLQQWRIFLHPTQRKLAEMDASGPVRVLGGAGTGKTVVLMHRTRYLAQALSADERVLVTTFTRNLATDLAQNLRALCGSEFERLEIINLHAWAAQFLRRQGVKFQPVDEETRRERMEMAADEVGDGGLPRGFFLEEWDRVVQAQEILERDTYFQARRTGRGTRLDRRQRVLAWEVFARYRESLHRDGLLDWQDVVREARLLLEVRKVPLPYQAVCADEVQDFTPSELRLLRALVPSGRNDLFLVGDGHQRIYGQPVVLSQCGIDVRGRSRRLRLNYRTTDRIAKHGLAVLRDCTVDDLDGGVDSLKGYTSLRRGQPPVLRHFQSETEEAQFVVATVKEWLVDGAAPNEICVAARTNGAIRDRYRPLLQQAGITTYLLKRDAETTAATPGVRLATMHRMKGLEFPRVVLASVQDGMVPLRSPVDVADPAESAARESQERCLFYVASTRARDELVVTGFGAPSPFTGPPHSEPQTSD
jgi:superfamily I DNA/RNA helicase/mRNA-degrading endonuclease RelE of RelBE toxin-antitoxin system